MQSSSSLQDIPDSHPPTIILVHTCSLACITGMITDCQHLKAVRKQSSPADIRKLGEYFLQSFGYDSEVKLAISNAYCLSQSADEFCDFLCPRGMLRDEAQWLIVFSNTIDLSLDISLWMYSLLLSYYLKYYSFMSYVHDFYFILFYFILLYLTALSPFAGFQVQKKTADGPIKHSSFRTKLHTHLLWKQ